MGMTTIDRRDQPTDDEVVDLLLDLPAAIALADSLRDQSLGGDTVADRGHVEVTEPA